MPSASFNGIPGPWKSFVSNCSCKTRMMSREDNSGGPWARAAAVKPAHAQQQTATIQTRFMTKHLLMICPGNELRVPAESRAYEPLRGSGGPEGNSIVNERRGKGKRQIRIFLG